MRFGVLGPVDAWVGARPVDLGSERERLVVAELLLAAGSVVPTRQLIEDLWTRPPASAAAQVHNMMSRVRRRLRTVCPDDVIRTRRGGYLLSLTGHELDLDEFRTLTAAAARHVTQNRLDDAAADLERALRLWRGPALADLPAHVAAGFRDALAQERAAAAENRLDVLLGLGRHDAVLLALEPMLREDPYRERLHEVRLRALAAAGRRTEALGAYLDLYRQLDDELGVPPGPALRELNERILRGDDVAVGAAGTARVRPVPWQLPPLPSVVAGRAELVDAVVGVLTAPPGTAGPVVLLHGPGGVGKTTTAALAGRRLDARYPDGQLYVNLRGTGPDPATPHAVLGRLLRDLGVDDEAVPEDPDERVALYRSHLAERRVLVVLDDAAGEAQLRSLLPPRPTSAAIVTSRRRLGALLDAARWTVPVLDPDAACRLLAETVGADRVAREPGEAAEIVRLCGCLPLAVRVAAGRLAVRPQWTLGELARRLADQRGRLDELVLGDLDVRATLALSHAALTAPQARLFARLSLLPPGTWPAWVADVLLDAPAGALLEELADAHLVERHGTDFLGQHRFGMHDLVAELGREHAAGEDPGPARDRLVTAWSARAEDAIAAGPGHAVAWFGLEGAGVLATAHEVLTSGAARGAGLAGQLVLRLDGMLATRSQDQERVALLRAAAGASRRHRDDALTVRLVGALYNALAQRDEHAELASIAAEELAAARRLGDRAAECRALSHLGRVARLHDRYREAAERMDEALALARSPDVPPVLLTEILGFVARLHTDVGDLGTALSCLEESVAVVRSVRPGSRVLAINLQLQGLTLMEAGRLVDARAALAEAAAITADVADSRGAAWVEHARAEVDLRAGAWTRAAVRLDGILPVMREVDDREGIAAVQRSLGDLALGRGTPAAAREPLAAALALYRQLGVRLEEARVLARLALAEPGRAAELRSAVGTILEEVGLDDGALRLPAFLRY